MEEKGTTDTTNNDEEELRSCLNLSSREDKIELRLTSRRPVAVSGFARNPYRRCFSGRAANLDKSLPFTTSKLYRTVLAIFRRTRD